MWSTLPARRTPSPGSRTCRATSPCCATCWTRRRPPCRASPTSTSCTAPSGTACTSGPTARRRARATRATCRPTSTTTSRTWWPNAGGAELGCGPRAGRASSSTWPLGARATWSRRSAATPRSAGSWACPSTSPASPARGPRCSRSRTRRLLAEACCGCSPSRVAPTAPSTWSTATASAGATCGPSSRTCSACAPAPCGPCRWRAGWRTRPRSGSASARATASRCRWRRWRTGRSPTSSWASSGTCSPPWPRRARAGFTGAVDTWAMFAEQIAGYRAAKVLPPA